MMVTAKLQAFGERVAVLGIRSFFAGMRYNLRRSKSNNGLEKLGELFNSDVNTTSTKDTATGN